MSSEGSAEEVISEEFCEESDESQDEEEEKGNENNPAEVSEYFAQHSDRRSPSRAFPSMSSTNVTSRTMPSGNIKTVFSWSSSKGAIPKQSQRNRQSSDSLLVESLSKSFDQGLHLTTEQPNQSKSTNPKILRMRYKSEPSRKLRDDAYNRRTRPHVPAARQTNIKTSTKSKEQSSPQNTVYATRKLLSARKLKIDDLRNRIMDLERQLLEEEKEKKVLQSLSKRQQKELEKVERSKMDIPEIEKAHDNEIRALKALMRKIQDKNKELETKLKSKDEELQRRFTLCQKLKVALQQKKRVEGESDKRLNALKAKIQRQEETIMVLKENVCNLERRLSEERMGHEAAKHSVKSLKKRCDEMKRRSSDAKCVKWRNKSVPSVENIDKSSLKASTCSKESAETQRSQEVHAAASQEDNMLSIKPAERSMTADNSLPTEEKEFLPPQSKYLSPKRNSKSSMSQALGPFLNKELGKQISPKCSPRDVRKAFKERLCSSADSSRRFPPNFKHAGMELIDVPLIIPSSAPRQSTPTESDSSSYQMTSQEPAGQYPFHRARERFLSSEFSESSAARKR